MTEFPLEWAAVGVIVLIDAVWALRIGFSLTLSWRDGFVVVVALAVGVILRTVVRQNQASLIAEYFALSTGAAAAFLTLSYLCCAVDYPLVDADLLYLDRELGFDWLHGFRFLRAHSFIADGLRILYNSIVYQGLYFAVFIGLLGRKSQLREVFWIMFVSGAVTATLSAYLPALGPYEAFGLAGLTDYLPDVEQLRSGINLHFTLADMKGVVTFPSFHTTLALVYAYGFRGTGIIGHMFILLNFLMLPGILFYGGHYLVDMLGGAVVAAAAIGLTKSLLHLEQHAADRPVSA